VSKGHRTKFKRLRNQQRETRPYAVLYNAPVSDTKARAVLNIIKNKSAYESLDRLNYSSRTASRIIAKILKSAMANAENNLGLESKKLFIEETFANRAMILKRIQPRAKGRAYRIQKRYSHITIILNEKL
jgi:large subunit ribosomal protein L22